MSSPRTAYQPTPWEGCGGCLFLLLLAVAVMALIYVVGLFFWAALGVHA